MENFLFSAQIKTISCTLDTIELSIADISRTQLFEDDLEVTALFLLFSLKSFCKTSREQTVKISIKI